MSTSSSALSQTLQSITSIKLHELSKKKSSFNARKAQVLAQVDEIDNERDKIIFLLTSIAKVQGANASKELADFEAYELDQLLGGGLSSTNIRHFLKQSQYDPSIPPSLLPELEKTLRQLLDQKTEKFDYADLYSRLLTEWLKSDATKATESATSDSPVDEGEGFEFVEKQKERLKQLSEKFESVVFAPLEVDVAAIEELLSGLFVSEGAQKALTKLRKRIRTFGERMAANATPFDNSTLKWVITGLLKSDLLSDANKNTLEAFLKDDVVLAEIADVLNMRFIDLESWSWDAGEEGIPVEPRRQLNGKYRVVMDEDILQSIFLHYIGTIWAIEFNAALMEVVINRDVWQLTERMPRDQIEKHEYYLGRGRVRANEGIASARQKTYEQDFFMCQLPSSIENHNGAGGYDDEEADASRKASSAQTKQQLLRTIGTEVLINRSLYEQVAVVQSDLQWFATSTSHQTVDTICKFFSVPKVWRSFFQRYLAAPLRMIGLEGEQGQVRTRKRGVPIGHVFQKLFGELIVFSMDLAVNQEAGMLLYRLHDDLWLCGNPAKCAKAWSTMEQCAKIMGVEFNQAKTGSAYITENNVAQDAQVANTLPKGRVVLGFLELQAETGEWIIDQKQVDAHAKQLQKQLAECTSVFAWVQTWNSCIGRFFNYTFGEPANCFGRRHVDMILETHRRIQQELFSAAATATTQSTSSSSVTQYLKSLVSARFDMGGIPDAFLYFPEEIGGLGLRNPFLPFLVVRDQVIESPQYKMSDFYKAEKKAYKHFKKDFQELSDRGRRQRLDSILGKESDRYTNGHGVAIDKPKGNTWSGPLDKGSEFLTWQEFIEYRISSSHDLENTYNDLLTTPWKNDIQPSRDVSEAWWSVSSGIPELAWGKMNSERKWLVELYAKEVFERFGGLSLVEKGALPMGVLKVVRARKVVWQSVL